MEQVCNSFGPQPSHPSHQAIRPICGAGEFTSSAPGIRAWTAGSRGDSRESPRPCMVPNLLLGLEGSNAQLCRENNLLFPVYPLSRRPASVRNIVSYKSRSNHRLVSVVVITSDFDQDFREPGFEPRTDLTFFSGVSPPPSVPAQAFPPSFFCAFLLCISSSVRIPFFCSSLHVIRCGPWPMFVSLVP